MVAGAGRSSERNRAESEPNGSSVNGWVMDVKHFLVSVMQYGEESQVVSEAVWVA
jgi:hypothetical protein